LYLPLNTLRIRSSARRSRLEAPKVWKKKEQEPIATQRTAPPPPASRPQTRAETVALIGPKVSIRGEVSGQESLRIQGRVEGKVSLKGQDVTVGKSGKVQADIHARGIRVEGEVVGDLYGEQEIVIEASGQVTGNLVAPRVNLENGSRFKGSIDMETATQSTQAGPSQEKPGTEKGPGDRAVLPGKARQTTSPAASRPPGDPLSRS
jgi:cytoskeletal protein CcmA (bactofilin family)